MSRKVLVLIIAGLIPVSLLFSQQRASDFFGKDANVIWYGLDYSHAKYIGGMLNGQQGMVSPEEYKNLIIPFLNGLVIDEPEKYDLKETFHKNNVTIDTAIVGRVNRTLDTKNFQTYDTKEYKLDGTKIYYYLKNYTFQPTNNAIGIIVFVESINKIKTTTSYYITVFDNYTKQEIFTEHINAEMSGGFVKSLSAAAILDMFEQITKVEYKKWGKKYANQ